MIGRLRRPAATVAAAAAVVAAMAAVAIRVVAVAATTAVFASAHAARAAPDYPAYAPVLPGVPLRFPGDFGSHPSFRTEWWYVTGWLTTARGQPLGFQVTFFRSKPAIDEDNPSAFAPRQLLIAHCAISDPERGRLWHDQRIRREGFGLAEAEAGDTNVWIDRWALRRAAGDGDRGAYTVEVDADELALQLHLAVTQPPLLNGDSGFSRKGPAEESASYYYSVPHLKVSGSVRRGARSAEPVSGEAWLDHEWSSEYLDSQAVGWDWTGINLDDGGALMVFRIRAAGGATRFAGGTLRDADGRTQALSPADILLTPIRRWTSPRTGVVYPVAWRLRAGGREFELEPLMDDQENDARLSTGTIYWEGAIRAFESRRPVGRGYLELTGYADRLRLR
ncbi:MAG TPA: lipocalin-like domain-containing protein [Steroidobacteraceae bacterium]